MSYDNTNRGTISKNARKTEDKHPDIAGSINVDGRDYWINGWQKKNSQDGSTFYSLTVKPKEQRPEQRSRRQQSGYERDDPRTSYGRGEDDQDLPF